MVSLLMNDCDLCSRDYRQRRRHRKELANLMDNVDSENGENNIHLTSEHPNIIESVVPVETAEPTVENTNSLRRKRLIKQVNSDGTSEISIHTTAHYHGIVETSTPTEIAGSFERSNSFRRKRLVSHRNSENDGSNIKSNQQDHETDSVVIIETAGPTVEKSNSFRRKRNESGEENPFSKRKLDASPEIHYLATSLPPTVSPFLQLEANDKKEIPVEEKVASEVHYLSVTLIPEISKTESKETEEAYKNEINKTNEQNNNEPTKANIEFNEEKHNDSQNDLHALEDVVQETNAPLDEDEEDPLSFIQIKSAAQWKAVSKRISWNFEEPQKEDIEIQVKERTLTPNTPIKTNLIEVPNLIHDYENIQYDIYCKEDDALFPDFKPTK